MYQSFNGWIGVQGKNEQNIKDILYEAQKILNDNFGEHAITLHHKPYTQPKVTAGTEIIKYDGYMGEKTQTFDVGDIVYSEDYECEGVIVATTDYDGDVDDEGKTIYYPAKATVRFEGGAYDRFPDGFYDSVSIDSIFKDDK